LYESKQTTENDVYACSHHNNYSAIKKELELVYPFKTHMYRMLSLEKVVISFHKVTKEGKSGEQYIG